MATTNNAVLNQIVLVGRVGSATIYEGNEEIKDFARLTLAVNNNHYNQADKTRETQWYNVKAFDQEGINLIDKAEKGDLVQVTGRLGFETSVDKDGVSHTEPTIIIGGLKKVEKETKFKLV